MEAIKKINILSGINLYYIKDDKYKTLSMAVYLHREVKKNEVTKNSLLANVLKAGTKSYPSMLEISRHMEALYGMAYDVTLARSGNVQSIAALFGLIDDRFSGESLADDAVDMAFEFLFNPLVENGGFKKEYVETEKKNLKDNIEGLINDKRAYADFRCVELMCEGEVAGISEYGYVEDIPYIDEKSLYEHYTSIIAKSPIDIFIVGECDIEHIADELKEKFSSIEFDISPIEKYDAVCKNGDVKNISESFDVAQGKLAIGFYTDIKSTDELYFPLIVANSILGAGAHSKLFNNVREKSSLAYYVSSRIDKFSKIMLISSGIEFKNFERAKKEIMHEVDCVKNGDFTDEDILTAKEFIINQYKSHTDSPYLMRSFYMGQILHGGDDSVESAIEKVKKVTKEEMVEAFSHLKENIFYFLRGKEA